MRILNVPDYKPIRLGAEELIELGQASTAAPSVSPSARMIWISPEEATMLVKVVEDIVAFMNSYPLEYSSYCPQDRWQKSLTEVNRWTGQIKKQADAGFRQISVSADAVLRLVDIEKCVTAARDARLRAVKTGFILSASGVVADVVFGLKWIGLGLYLAGLGVIFGTPLWAKLRPDSQEPFKPTMGSCAGGPAEPAKKTVLERVIVSKGPMQGHWWGVVKPGSGEIEEAICLQKDRYRIRIEGWKGDQIIPRPGWKRVPVWECKGDVEIAVWDSCGEPARETMFGPVPKESGLTDTFWVEYTGPLTGGTCRTAGPFG